MPSSTRTHLNLFQLATRSAAQLRGRATEIVRRDVRQASPGDIRLQHLPDDLFAHPIAANLIAPVDRPEQMPFVTPASEVHASIAFFVHAGIGIVRTRPCLPTRSTMHQRLSRCWTCFIVRFVSSERRNPHPSSVANIARSRSPFFVRTSGAFSSACAQTERNRDVGERHREVPFTAMPILLVPLTAYSLTRRRMCSKFEPNLTPRNYFL